MSSSFLLKWRISHTCNIKWSCNIGLVNTSCVSPEISTQIMIPMIIRGTRIEMGVWRYLSDIITVYYIQ